MSKRKNIFKENGHIIGTTAQVIGTTAVTGWEFFENKINVTDMIGDQIAVTSPEDYIEYMALTGLISFVPIFYSKKDSAKRRRDAYLMSATSLAILSSLYFARGRISAGVSTAVGSLLNYRTAYENHVIEESKNKPFKLSGKGYLALNVLNITAGILDQNLGVIIGNSISAFGAKALMEAEPKKKRNELKL